MNRNASLARRVATLAIGLAPWVAVEASTPTPIELFWSDPYELIGAPATLLLREQLEALFAGIRVPVALRVPARDDVQATSDTSRIYVTLRPGNGVHWGLDERAMAAAVGEREGSYAIFVFVDSVRRTLGHPSKASPRHVVELSRALTRVVAHEVVHVLAPERGHAGSGLMSRTLTRKLLLADRIKLDLTSLVRARDGALRFAKAADTAGSAS